MSSLPWLPQGGQQQMQPAGPALQPVPPNMMIPGLPWRPPAGIPLPNVSPHLQEYAVMAAGHVLHELQTLANSNQMRLLLYWTAVQNNFQNDLFVGMVSNVLDYTEAMMAYYGNQYQPADFIKKGAGDVCRIMAIQLSMQHPSIMSMLDNNARNEVDQTLRYAAELAAQIQNYKNTVRASGFQNNVGVGINNGGGFPVGVQAGHVGRAMVGGGGGHYPGPASMMGRMGGGAPAAPVVSGTAYNDLFRSDGGNGARSLTGDSLLLPGTVVKEEDRRPVVTGASGVTTSLEVPSFMLPATSGEKPAVHKEKTMTAAATSTPLVSTPAGQKAPFPSKPPAGEFVWDDRKFVHANFTKLKPSYEIGLPYGTLYDRENLAMFYDVTNPKAVREIGVQLEVFGGMQPYEDHETYHLLNPRQVDKSVTPDREAARTSFLQILQARDLDVIVEERNKQQNEGVTDFGNQLKEPVRVEATNFLAMCRGVPYLTMMQDYFADNNLEMPADKVVNFRAEVCEPWTLKGDAAIRAMEIKYCKHWDTLLARVQKLRTLAHPTYWNILHANLTDAVNELVTRIMGIQAEITNFVEDLDALRHHLREKYGDSIAETFERQAKTIAQSVCSFDEVARGEEDTGIIEARYSIVEEVYLLPCNAEDFTWNYTGDSAVVTEKRLPELHAALKHHFDRIANVDNADVIRHHKFVTRDGKLTIFAALGVYHKDVYLVYTNR